MPTDAEVVTVLRGKLKAIEAEIAALEAKKRGLKDTLSLFSPVADIPLEPLRGLAEMLADPNRTTTSDMILEYVREHPGCKIVDVLDALQDKIDTTSANPRKVVRSVAASLEKRGKLRIAPMGEMMLLEEESKP